MIEQLDKHLAKNINSCNMSQNIMVAHKAIEKINELVDVVNSLRDDCNLLMGYIAPEDKCEPAENTTDSKMGQHQFAEQRKWVGKLCRFWDDDNTNSSCGILTSIDTETFKEPQFVCNDEYDYEHCEPVKPTDSLIYKGGDNE